MFADLVTADGIKSINTRALARIQTLPGTYTLLSKTRINGLAIGDGVPSYFVKQLYD